jgi:uncharacterized protein
MEVIRISGDPQAARFHLFDSAAGSHLLVIPYSRIFAVEREFAAALRKGDVSAVREAELLVGAVDGEALLDLVPETTPQSISLNVSTNCNLGCSYCYASGGNFGGKQSSSMSWKVAQAAVDRLLTLANPAAPVTIGFIGGEPLLNRRLINRVVDYAASSAVRRGIAVRFSVTTNGTLLNDEDLAMFRAYPFAVTVSIDGGRAVQDAQRPTHSGRSSFTAIQEAIAPLLESPGCAKIAARATVVRTDLNIGARFLEILGLGFDEVGFSPVRVAGGANALDGADWTEYLNAMIALADREVAGLFFGRPLRLTNLAVALKQLHRGFSMPYPCGAGGGYFSVGADGTWYACHRAIGQDTYALGDNSGLDQSRRSAFIRARHVHAQAECRLCWARYLCSGGCHQEASARSDSSCGFIRGWLDYCLKAYSEIVQRHPDWFDCGNRTMEVGYL